MALQSPGMLCALTVQSVQGLFAASWIRRGPNTAPLHAETPTIDVHALESTDHAVHAANSG